MKLIIKSVAEVLALVIVALIVSVVLAFMFEIGKFIHEFGYTIYAMISVLVIVCCWCVWAILNICKTLKSNDEYDLMLKGRIEELERRMKK